MPIALRKDKRAYPSHPMSNFVTYNRVSPIIYSFLSSYSEVIEALNHPRWRCAIKEEMSTLVQNDTQSLVSMPAEKSVFGCRWVFIGEVGPTSLVDWLKDQNYW